MSEYYFGITYTRPTRANAKKMDKICREEGGLRFDESEDGGRYRGWFVGPNRGAPFDGQLADRVSKRVSAECS